MTPDLLAASRVSRRVDVEDIRLAEVQLACEPFSVIGDILRLVESRHNTRADVRESGKFEVECKYEFVFHTSDDLAFTLQLVYRVLYELQGDDIPDENDLRHFADANGRYHTWPFVRETVASLTGKMSYCPYVLPALSFSPKVKEEGSETVPAIGEADDSDAERPADKLGSTEDTH